MADRPNALAAVTLDDKYTLERGRIYLTGTQALVRLPLLQRQRDVAAGPQYGLLYFRLSRLAARRVRSGAVERAPLCRAQPLQFQPAMNEELAATAVWGSQQIGLFPGARYDGVFAIWYGKGPGVDRSGDALKHGNSAGTAPMAACWRWPATITPANPRPCRTSPNSRLSTRDPGAEPGRGRRTFSISASTAGRCRAVPGAGWR